MRDAPRIWVTGAAGLIGAELVRLAPDVELVALSRQTFDLTDWKALENRFQKDDPNLIIHCAGLTRSPACQADPARAQLLNVEVTTRLAELAANRRLIFFS